MAETEVTDARAVFDALGPAWDKKKAKEANRDKASAALDVVREKAKADYDAAIAKATAELESAQNDFSAAVDDLKAVQRQIDDLTGHTPDPTRIR